MCACECCNGVLSSVQDGRSPLYVASEFGHTEVVDILLKNGACTNLATKVLRLVCSKRYCIFLSLAQLTTHLTCRVSFGCGCSCVCQRVSRNGSNTACTLQSLHQRFMSFGTAFFFYLLVCSCTILHLNEDVFCKFPWDASKQISNHCSLHYMWKLVWEHHLWSRSHTKMSWGKQITSLLHVYDCLTDVGSINVTA